MSTSTRPQGDPDGLMVWADVVVMAVGKIIVAAAVGLWWLLRHRPRSVLLGVVSAAVLFGVYSGPVGWAWIAAGLVGLFLWRVAHEESFALVTRPPKLKMKELMPHNPIGDTLTAPRSPLPPPVALLDPTGLEHLHVGTMVDDDSKGKPWELSVRETHILIGGLSGAGKSSVIWSLLRALGPYIRTGQVEVWACDPKGGAELTFGVPLFAKFAVVRDGNAEPVALLLEAAVAKMSQRLDAMVAAKSRKHLPTPAAPQIIVLIDEMTVLAEIPDTKIKGRVKQAMFWLLTQGRAAGVTVVGAGQDLRKERLNDRPMFNVCVALRMERIQVDMVLGPGAWDKGAKCDEISRKQQGVGYVVVDDGNPRAVRSFWLDDEAVGGVALVYRRP